MHINITLYPYKFMQVQGENLVFAMRLLPYASLLSSAKLSLFALYRFLYTAKLRS